jgi:hypothetical protein
MFNKFECVVLAQLPTPNSLYETLFNPTMVLLKQNHFILSAMASYRGKNIATYMGTLVPNTVSPKMASYFLISSHFDFGFALAGYSLTYRISQLVATAIQHKIEQSNLSKNEKFWISGAVTALPLLMIYLVGGSCQEMAFASLVKVIASRLLPPVYSNPVKELDLISTTKNFTVTGFLSKNFLTIVRNIVTTALVMDGLVSFFEVGKTSITELLTPPTESISFKICRHNRIYELVQEGPYSHSLLLVYFVDECAWMLGKIAVDGVFILLNQLGIVKDLRDPLGDLLQPFFQRAPLKRRAVQAPVPHSATRIRQFQRTGVPALPAPPVTVQPPQAPQNKSLSSKRLRRQAREKQLALAAQVPVDFPTTSHNLPTDDERLGPKTKVKTRGSSQVKASEVPEEEVLSMITIPNYPRKVVALWGQGIENVPNVWGVISYGIRGKEKYDVRSYMTGLNAGHVGPTGSHAVMKYLGKSRKTHQPIYSIRPANQEMRLIGELICGEEAVYDALKSAFGYERALALTHQIKNNDEEMNLIDFRFIATHKQISEFLALS